MNTLLSYRPHIDGLRAVAVWLVVLFHLNATIFNGGYLGVDIFFVISGFVITQSLYKEYLINGSINIFDFYLRRFKRLYPALVTMLLGTTFSYFFFGFLWDTNLYLKSVFSALFASSNLYFLYHGNNYFNEDLINPLVHTWSLGVEEQFYLLYPMCLAGLLMLGRRYKLSLDILSLVLFATSVILYFIFALNQGSLIGNFYFPFARFWELGLGCVMMFLSITVSPGRFISWSALCGVVIFVVVQIFHSAIGIVPIETALAVFSTICIIYGGLYDEQGFVVRCLSKPLIVYIGKLSYSLYLWHLPVIYFANLYLSPSLTIVVAPAVSVLFAILSYHFVETPLRYSKLLGLGIIFLVRLIPIIIIIGIVIISIFGFSTVRTVVNTHFNSFGEFIGSINFIETNFSLGARIQPDYLPNDDPLCETHQGVSSTFESSVFNGRCLKFSNDDTQPIFYLAGDSHALHFVPAFYTSDIVKNLIFTSFPTNSIVGDLDTFDDSQSQKILEMQVTELKTLDTDYQQIYYVTSLFLTPYQNQIDLIERNLRRYIESLQKYAVVIFIAPTPVFTSGPESCVLLGKHCSISRATDRENQRAIIELFQRLDMEYDRVFVFDPYPAVCPNDFCFNYIADSDTLVYRDDDHIAVEQSKQIVSELDAWLRINFSTLR